MVQILLLIWGCVPELATECHDMTNASSTYLGMMIGALIGGLISWLIYNRQKLTSKKQDHALDQIKKINEHQDHILKRLEDSDKRHDRTLNTILDLNKRIDAVIEGQAGLLKSFKSTSPAATETKE